MQFGETSVTSVVEPVSELSSEHSFKVARSNAAFGSGVSFESGLIVWFALKDPDEISSAAKGVSRTASSL